MTGQNAVDAAIATLLETLALPDSKARRETKGRAAQTIVSAANRAARNNPSTTINTGMQITLGDLLRLIPAEGVSTTTGGIGAPPTPATPLSLPRSVPQEDLRLVRLVHGRRQFVT